VLIPYGALLALLNGDATSPATVKPPRQSTARWQRQAECLRMGA
jgi:hypothetical protein